MKSDLPDDGYSSTAGSNYVTVALLDRNAQIVPPTDALPTSFSNSSTSSKSVPTGAIVGGVIGGLALLVLLALLIFCCLRRRRKKREEINAATQRMPPDSLQTDAKSNSPFSAHGGK